MKRKWFLFTPLCLAGFLFVFLFSCDKENESAIDNLYQQFQQADEKYSPGVWWWWNGNALTQKEIIRQLDTLKNAGIGEVSVVPMEIPEDVESLPQGFEKLKWMSPKWKKMLEFTIKQAEKRNIKVHISIGQGWPLGDILHKYPAEIVITSKKSLKGPLKFQVNAWKLFQLPEQYTWRYRAKTLIDSSIIALRLVPARPDSFTTGIDLLEKMDKYGNFSCDIPGGGYELYITQWQKGYSYTKHNPDNHLILNYLNKQAVRETMDSAFAKYQGIEGLNKIVSLYHDSWELDEQNWTSDFAREFEERKGYPILPYLPFVSNFYLSDKEAKTPFYDTIQHVRYDFITTIQALFEERCLQPLVEWNKKHGFLFRNQAYGREQHPLDANFYPDIPEGESWFRKKQITVSMINKYVASAALLSDKTLITCETNTNVNSIYRIDLDEIKRLTDQTFISGINHIFLHGYNYSPLQAGIPGWVRYGTYFSEHNPWWKYMPAYTSYIRRVASVLQNSRPTANIGIFTPDADIWKKQSRVFKPFPEQIQPGYIYETWKAIHSCGYNCCYLSDKIIAEAHISQAGLNYNKSIFNAIIFEDVNSISITTLKKVEEYVENGGKVIFIGQKPIQAPGLKNARQKKREIIKTDTKLIEKYPKQVFSVDSPTDKSGFVDYVWKILQPLQLEPAISFQSPDEYISQIHHKKGDTDIFFIVNSHPENARELLVENLEPGIYAYLWNPQNGKRFKIQTNKNNLKAWLPAASSWFLVLDKKNTKAPYYDFQPVKCNNELKVDKWNIHCQPVNSKKFVLDTTSLFDFSEAQKSSIQEFSGTLTYHTEFDWQKGYFSHILIPAKNSVTEVFINDKRVGINYFGKHLYKVKDVVKPGKNTLKIKVSTTLANFMLNKSSMARNRWPAKFEKPIKTGIYQPILTN